ncbi:hypothetical protein MSAN_00952300 [Mycena sanguinolenta]|uniref:DUF6924 domain-containing protein n=1 Tax=Mycena sanguinolenta TaxID=230812 RepID=A0A8H6YZ47_9AGAR|nr:hypothetical protein MSAN_00952300 [Mycena sanguinolenta]
MSSFAVFVTAKPTPKALNRALLLIQDFEFGEYPQDSNWTLLTSKELPASAPATTLPVSDIRDSNGFAGMSFSEINKFVRANEEALKDISLSSGDWLIIDQKGFETSTCLVVEQVYDYGEEDDDDDGGGEGGLTDEFRACRIPYEEAHSMVVNLDIANMGFEDWVDEDAGEQEDGAWKWRSFGQDPTDDDEVVAKRRAALQQLRDAGYAD